MPATTADEMLLSLSQSNIAWMEMLPHVGRSRSPIMLRSVLLLDPDGPMSDELATIETQVYFVQNLRLGVQTDVVGFTDLLEPQDLVSHGLLPRGRDWLPEARERWRQQLRSESPARRSR